MMMTTFFGSHNKLLFYVTGLKIDHLTKPYYCKSFEVERQENQLSNPGRVEYRSWWKY